MSQVEEAAFDELILKSFTCFVENSSHFKGNSDCTNEFLNDEIVRSYIVNSIKQFYDEYDCHKIWLHDDDQVAFDLEDIEMDSFIEVIDAYFNGFMQINQNEIVNWLIALKKEINERNKINQSTIKSSPEKSNSKNDKQQQQGNNNGENDDNELKVKSVTLEDLEIQQLRKIDQNINLLIEMFPHLKLNQVVNTYKRRNKDYEKTIDDLLVISSDAKAIRTRLRHHHDDDTGSLTASDQSDADEPDSMLKEKIVQRFGFVAEPTDPNVKYAPVAKWDSEKKMVRYFDNKVVTTKGDKYFEPKTEEEEEESKRMKKTFINLKPARKYRFH
jgi:hypothetical protein